MEQQELIIALLNTVLIILAIPIIGLVIGIINKAIIKILYNTLGLSAALIIANYLTFLGTVHHELSHALVAFITGAKIKKIDLFKPNGTTLGKVEFIPRGGRALRSIQLSMSAVAPVILGCISTTLLLMNVNNINTIWLKIFCYYTVFSILMHMTLSWQDIKVAIKGLPICFIVIFLIFSFSGLNLLSFINIL